MIFTPRLNSALAYRLHQNSVKRLMIVSLEFDQAEIAWSFAEHLFDQQSDSKALVPHSGLEMACLPLYLADHSRQAASLMNQISTYDAVVLVIETGRCQSHQLEQAVQQIKTAGGNLIGVIANDRVSPPLNLELCRQLDRVGRFLPFEWVERWKHSIMGMPLLNIDV